MDGSEHGRRGIGRPSVRRCEAGGYGATGDEAAEDSRRHPESPVPVFVEHSGDRRAPGGIERETGIEYRHLAVIAVQPVRCRIPQKAAMVLQDLIYVLRRHSLRASQRFEPDGDRQTGGGAIFGGTAACQGTQDRQG